MENFSTSANNDLGISSANECLQKTLPDSRLQVTAGETSEEEDLRGLPKHVQKRIKERGQRGEAEEQLPKEEYQEIERAWVDKHLALADSSLSKADKYSSIIRKNSADANKSLERANTIKELNENVLEQGETDAEVKKQEAEQIKKKCENFKQEAILGKNAIQHYQKELEIIFEKTGLDSESQKFWGEMRESVELALNEYKDATDRWNSRVMSSVDLIRARSHALKRWRRIQGKEISEEDSNFSAESDLLRKFVEQQEMKKNNLISEQNDEWQTFVTRSKEQINLNYWYLLRAIRHLQFKYEEHFLKRLHEQKEKNQENELKKDLHAFKRNQARQLRAHLLQKLQEADIPDGEIPVGVVTGHVIFEEPKTPSTSPENQSASGEGSHPRSFRFRLPYEGNSSWSNIYLDFEEMKIYYTDKALQPCKVLYQLERASVPLGDTGEPQLILRIADELPLAPLEQKTPVSSDTGDTAEVGKIEKWLKYVKNPSKIVPTLQEYLPEERSSQIPSNTPPSSDVPNEIGYRILSSLGWESQVPTVEEGPGQDTMRWARKFLRDQQGPAEYPRFPNFRSFPSFEKFLSLLVGSSSSREGASDSGQTHRVYEKVVERPAKEISELERKYRKSP